MIFYCAGEMTLLNNGLHRIIDIKFITMVSAFSVPKAARGTPPVIQMKSSPKIQALDNISKDLPMQP
jgi:hypothetical protein